MLIVLFLVSHFKLLFVPCGGLSWLPVSFLLHVKYTLSYLSYKTTNGPTSRLPYLCEYATSFIAKSTLLMLNDPRRWKLTSAFIFLSFKVTHASIWLCSFTFYLTLLHVKSLNAFKCLNHKFYVLIFDVLLHHHVIHSVAEFQFTVRWDEHLSLHTIQDTCTC